jgi:hypothetical protein
METLPQIAQLRAIGFLSSGVFSRRAARRPQLPPRHAEAPPGKGSGEAVC